MTWVDKKLYWAWYEKGTPDCNPPHIKTIEYVTILFPSGIKQNQAVAVYDNGVKTDIDKYSLDWVLSKGGGKVVDTFQRVMG